MLAPLMAIPVRAQERTVQRHRAADPEGRLIAFYSSAMLFSPVGAAPGAGGLSLGMDATWLPRLSEAQRRPGIDKPETTNLAPVVPRPRLAWRAPGGIVVEGSWIPPLQVGEAKANVVAGAISRTLGVWRGVSFTPRLSAVAGRVSGAITCNARTARGGRPSLAIYYLNVCHDRDSDDYFEPRLLAGELVASRRLPRIGAEAYAALGARADRTRFDIGVIRSDGSRDPDHPVLRLHDTRAHLSVGGRWDVARHFGAAAEWFYAPGSISSVRLYAGWRR